MNDKTYYALMGEKKGKRERRKIPTHDDDTNNKKSYNSGESKNGRGEGERQPAERR